MVTRFAAVLAAVLFIAPAARGDLVLQFGQGGVAGITEFTGQVGSTIEIEVYLTQVGNFTIPGVGSFPDQRLTNLGLSAFQFQFEIGGTGGATHDAVMNPNPTSTFVFGSGWVNDLQTAFPDNNFAGNAVPALQLLQAGALASFDGGAGLFDAPVFPGAGEDSVLLGTASIDLNSQGTFALELGRNANNGLAFILGTDPFGGVAVLGGTATLSAVPEPSSFLALGGCLAAGVAGRIRRRKKAAKN